MARSVRRLARLARRDQVEVGKAESKAEKTAEVAPCTGPPPGAGAAVSRIWTLNLNAALSAFTPSASWIAADGSTWLEISAVVGCGAAAASFAAGAGLLVCRSSISAGCA